MTDPLAYVLLIAGTFLLAGLVKGVIGLGLVHGSRQWTVAGVVAVLALVLLLITLGRRPVRPVEASGEPGRAGVALRD